MPKFKFTNSYADAADGVTNLPCRDAIEWEHVLAESLVKIRYTFDKYDDLFLDLNIAHQWFRQEDLDELIKLLKAAKRYGQKLEAKRLAGV